MFGPSLRRANRYATAAPFNAQGSGMTAVQGSMVRSFEGLRTDKAHHERDNFQTLEQLGGAGYERSSSTGSLSGRQWRVARGMISRIRSTCEAVAGANLWEKGRKSDCRGLMNRAIGLIRSRRTWAFHK